MGTKLSAKLTDKWKELVDNAWLNLDEDDLFDFINPFDLMTEEDKLTPDLFLLDMLRKPENFGLTCKILFDIDLMPYQLAILQVLWKTPFPIFLASRGAGKTFLTSLYLLLRAIFLQGRRIVIVAPGFRQAKNAMNYIINIWDRSPILQDLLSGADIKSGPKMQPDRVTLQIGYSTINALPLGNGEKIRGERANDTYLDEFQSFESVEVIEKVIGGFSIVSSNPVEQVKQRASMDKLRELGVEVTSDMETIFVKNQQLISGTASYEWNHFCQYHGKWKTIIESRGDKNILGKLFMTDQGPDIPEGFDWKDYAIVRLPVNLLPKNYMDAGTVARAKASMTVGIYEMEYLCCFSRDSTGFFKASLIHNATATEENRQKWQAVGFNVDHFVAKIKGDKDKRYIIGIDPASERDNFAIVILELHENCRRIVYCTTFKREKHIELLRNGMVEETDFYGYCARRIRNLLEIFPCSVVGIDSQGGGIHVMEALHSVHHLKQGEQMIWPVIEDKYKDSDSQPGLHIMQPVQFSNSKWTSEANHGMKKDFEDKVLIFPHFDSVSLVETEFSQSDSLEECMLEIEEMKTELIQIIHSQTPNGTERWDTTEEKISGSKKSNRKKDRYSALLIANAVARNLDKPRPGPIYTDGMVDSPREWGSNPDWFKPCTDHYGFV